MEKFVKRKQKIFDDSVIVWNSFLEAINQSGDSNG